MDDVILVRGGGDIASGVALRLFRSGFKVLMTELEKPLTVRRMVSFSEAIYKGFITVEGITARRILSVENSHKTNIEEEIPIIVDENLKILDTKDNNIPVLIDARMEKRPSDPYFFHSVPLLIGIGPGFTAGFDCHIVIESNRGHSLGRIYRHGKALSDTGYPAGDPARILRAPTSGIIHTHSKIGDVLESGSLIANIAGHPVLAPFTGLLRGLIHSDIDVQKGMKIGDMDKSTDTDLCNVVSDKAMAIAGSVLEVILSDTHLLPSRRDPPAK
jgi:xanthine dehydrogenase accessory factor